MTTSVRHREQHGVRGRQSCAGNTLFCGSRRGSRIARSIGRNDGVRMMKQILPTPWKPTKAQLLAARDKLVPDLIAKDLIVLFAGINPGLYTAAIGRHFGRPGNRFWPALYAGGFTPRLFSPFESDLLLDLNLGITNVVDRATARADELTNDELRAGGNRLE